MNTNTTLFALKKTVLLLLETVQFNIQEDMNLQHIHSFYCSYLLLLSITTS